MRPVVSQARLRCRIGSAVGSVSQGGERGGAGRAPHNAYSRRQAGVKICKIKTQHFLVVGSKRNKTAARPTSRERQIECAYADVSCSYATAPAVKISSPPGLAARWAHATNQHHQNQGARIHERTRLCTPAPAARRRRTSHAAQWGNADASSCIRPEVCCHVLKARPSAPTLRSSAGGGGRPPCRHAHALVRLPARVQCEDHDGEEGERARLVGGAEVDGDGVDDGRDPE